MPEEKKGMTYADAGVNVELGDEVSAMLYNAAKQTWKNRKGKIGELVVPFDDFSGLRVTDVSGLPEGTIIHLGFDGIGTKVEIAQRCSYFRTVAHDLLAMVCDDALVRGAEPALVGTIIDVNFLGPKENPFRQQVNHLAQGYIEAADAANVAIFNGEVAELGDLVGGFGDFHFNWGAAVIGYARKDRMFTGREIKPGDFLVGLAEYGMRSNGISLLRKALTQSNGKNWHDSTLDGQSIGMLALTPSTIYSKAVVEMFGGYDGEPKAVVHGFAHITGGGLPGKLGRVLKPSGLGADITDPFEPCKLMEYCQAIAGIEDREAYRSWNMGQGGIVITTELDKVIEIAASHGIDAKIIGQVTEQKGIRIKNNGYHKKEEVLDF
ncbi:hypothetical protein JW707_01970 [Candidatus Woesearchaeota archaeon]|nr:hypothetical protein [Candidatus Woesearchaeota archaeon]